MFGLDADNDRPASDALLEIPDKERERKAVGGYVFLADLPSVNKGYGPRSASADGRVNDKDMCRSEIPDEAGKALGSIPGIDDPKLKGMEYPQASPARTGFWVRAFGGALFSGQLPLEQTNAEGSCGVVTSPKVPDPENEQPLGSLDFLGNRGAPISSWVPGKGSRPPPWA